jgi:hypothetical protein
MARRCTDIRDTNAGLGEIGCPTWNRTKTYGFRDRRATLALQGRNWRGPTAQGQSNHDLLALLHSDGVSLGGAESPDRFLGCIGIKSALGSMVCIHRRKCHLADAVAPSPGWSGRAFGLSGKTPLGLCT